MDKLIVKRFAELSSAAEAILSEKRNVAAGMVAVNRADVTKWGTSVLNLLRRVFGEDSVHLGQFQKRFDSFPRWEGEYRELLGVFESAREDYEGGYLFNMRSLIQAEVFDDALEQAAELLRAGYKDPACVVAGVTLETTLKQLCSQNGISLAKLDRMNADLCKAGVYNMGMQKQITAWADRRNSAAHGDSSAYSKADVEDMIKGVTRLIADKL